MELKYNSLPAVVFMLRKFDTHNFLIMTRTRNTTSRTSLKPSIKNIDKNKALSVYVDKLVQKKLASKHKQYRLDKEDYKNMLEKIKSIGIKWITLCGLKFRVLRAFKNVIKEDPPPPDRSNELTTASSNKDTSRCYGRPKGTTNLNNEINKNIETLAKKRITQQYYQRLINSDNMNNRLSNGTYDLVLQDVKNEFDLDDTFSFPYGACMKRIYRGKEDSECTGALSPLHDIEEKFVTIILALANIGCPVTVGETLCLMQSLIEGTESQKRLIAYQEKHHYKLYNEFGDAALGKLSRNYYYGFMRRHKEVIDSNKGKRFEAMRTSWMNYRNFSHMFDDIEKIMIDARVADKFSSPVYMNSKGDIVDNVQESFGCKVTTSLNLPELCIVMDEVGGDLNMLNDGHSGGAKYLARKGDTPKINSTKKKKKFTVLGLTTLNGTPLMCVVIFEGKERNVFVESGIDPFHPLYDSFEGDVASSNFGTFEDNYGPGKLFPGGPVCTFEGTSIPTMVRYSERGSITNEILTDILRTIDKTKIYQPYREQGAIPFLLVDGHQSRFSMEFLEYITDPSHLWKVSIGVPYGTSLWQVGDSYQQNGRFKISLTDSKKRIMEKRLMTFCPEMELIATDIMPMIRLAWDKSFADIQGNKDAIAERGLNPLNRNLLLLDDLRRTMTELDKDEERANNLLTREKLMLIQIAAEANNEARLPEGNVLRTSLNFNHNYARIFVDKIVGHSDLENARSRNLHRSKCGTNTKELLKQVKKLTSAGEIVKVGNTHELGIDLLEEVRRRKAEQDLVTETKLLKKQQERHEKIHEYVELLKRKPDETSWTIADLKIAIRALKVDEDGRTPNVKQEIITLFEKIKHRHEEVIFRYNAENDINNG